MFSAGKLELGQENGVEGRESTKEVVDGQSFDEGEMIAIEIDSPISERSRD